MEKTNLFSKIKTFVLKHKIFSVLVLIILATSPFAVNYFMPQKTTVNYVTQAVKKGNIEVSVSGTGQVSSLKTVNISSEVSGDVISVNVEAGDEVDKGDVLFRLDPTDAAADVKDAEISLESAKVKLEDLTAPVDELTLLQAEDSLTEAQESKTNAESNLEKSYDDGFNNVSSAFLDLPSIMTGLNNILFSKTLSTNSTQQNIDFYATAINYYDDGKGSQYKEDAATKYATAKEEYDKTLADYKATTRYSDKDDIEALITETYSTLKSIAEAIRSANNLIELYKYTLSNRQMTYLSAADTHVSTLSSYTSKVNSNLSTMLSSDNSIDNYKDSIVSAERSIKMKELSLEDVKEGATDLEIRTQELAIEKAEQALSEAKQAYNDCWVTAPFSGTISSVSSIVGDSVNSGTAMATIITKKMIATITLNEVDISNVEIGQKVNLTFDALDDVSVEGEVSEVDTVGTVSQGVVSYTVKIAFDTDNSSIKPGMSISASIISSSVSDVLTVPSSAVKTMGKENYVEVMNNGQIERKTVETGLTDDTTIEIKSGLTEGEKVITSSGTKSSTATTTKTTTNSNSQGGPQGGSGMDMMMITR